MEYEGYLSGFQYRTLVITMGVSSLISILGSVAVTRISYLKMTSTYQRFLFMLSLVIIVNSIFLLFHQLMIPESPDYLWAFGISETCTMMGFFLHFGCLSMAMYSCYLSVYFYFSIQNSPKRQKNPEDIIGAWEWCAHLSCFLVPAAIAGVAAGTGNIDLDEGLGLCIITSNECKGREGFPGCVTMGKTGWTVPSETSVLSWTFAATLLAVSIICVAATVSVFSRVRATLVNSDVGDLGLEGTISAEMKQRLRAVASQSVLYTTVYVNSFIWPILAVVIPTTSGAAVFGIQLMACLVYPMQGIFICFIYIRPRYQMLTVMYPEDSALVVFRVSMSKAGDPEEIEEVRERIYGDAYEMPSVGSSDQSIASDIPLEVSFDPNQPASDLSLVSTPDDNDDMDPEADAKSIRKKIRQTKSANDDETPTVDIDENKSK